MDLFAAAAEERLESRAPLGGPAATPQPRRGRRPARPARRRAGRCGRSSSRTGSPSVILWGPPGTGKTTHRPPDRRRDRQGVRAAERGERGCEGRPRGRRAGPAPARRARPGHDPVPRRGAPVQPHPAGRAAPARRGRAARPRRRHHREPVLLADRAAAQPLDALPARAARAATTCGRSIERALADKTRGLGDDAPRRSTTTRSTTSSTAPRATPATRSTSLEVAGRARGRGRAQPTITLAYAEAALAMRALRYGDDEHYDVISAFIKSIRGSDVDAGALLARPHARGR